MTKVDMRLVGEVIDPIGFDVAFEVTPRVILSNQVMVTLHRETIS